MFTGIVDHVGQILKAETTATGRRLTVSTRFENLVLGESIAVDGTCLTVTDFSSGEFRCELSPETLGLTISPRYEIGSLVNLERALKVGDALGGHWVLGHVDGTATIKAVETGVEFWKITVEGIEKKNQPLLAPKGSVAINGVSLTVNDVSTGEFEVMLIPHTLERTNLRFLGAGSLVNLEFDYLAKLVVQRMELHAKRI